MSQQKENPYRQQRLEKADRLREAGINPYGNKLKAENLAKDILAKYDGLKKEELEANPVTVDLAGRVIAVRSFGKAGFLRIRDRSGLLQAYYQKGKMGEDGDVVLKNLEVGDLVCVKGTLFRTKTDELTIQADSLGMVTKAIEQLPEKWHGLTDVEARYRRRYVDLIANPEVKDVFEKRSRIVSFIRRYLEEREFLEVETPMMHPIPGGAKARPFVTHHNTLDMELFLRIAPELYLKRLVVGGIERVFEINRNFRNEGISTQHNPEFTMLEFYMAYANYEDLIELTEDMLNKLAVEVCGSEVVSYQGKDLSFAKPFARYTLLEALQKHLDLSESDVQDRQKLLACCEQNRIKIKNADSVDLGIVQLTLFEELIENKLISPTFITHYPTSVSPLSRKNDDNGDITDRFELFIAGREIANAFSELNDPVDQAERFRSQVEEREGGDDEAMFMDHDYVKALEFGMPPAAGEGIGIDRLVMLLTDAASIRDVILFPILRKESGGEA
ncbi:MAG: lysine--tRNA ligase [Deltaproteobacteria bacterium]|nr:lysine--tRNA ligase [Deltaproteobacteria bacterium]